jgi:hypothetical protein
MSALPPKADSLTIAHRGNGLFIRPDLGAFPAACLADEPSPKIRQPDIVGPAVGADRDRATALVIRATDQDAAHASGPNLAEGDFLWAGEAGNLVAMSSGWDGNTFVRASWR